MNEFLWLLAGLVLVAVFVLSIMWKLSRRRKVSATTKRVLLAEWAQVEQLQDSNRAIVDAEKIVDHALKELGYTGTFADKLRTAGPRFSAVQSLWEAHKLRNRIAHEVGVHISTKEAKTSLAAFKRALKDLL